MIGFDPAQTPHTVLAAVLKPEITPPLQSIIFALGCFWGAERKFWQTPGVYTTAVGYAGGALDEPTYQQVCTGLTGHAECVLVVFNQEQISLQSLLEIFWQSHDPTQGMRQGNDIGTQYRSAIFYQANQKALVEQSYIHYQAQLDKAGFGPITTQLAEAPPFYYAELYHQQYLHKNPNGYCGLKSTGIVY